MYLNLRLFSFTSGVRWTLALSAALGLLTAAAGVARLALSGYAIALVFRGAPSSEIGLTVGAIVVSILLRAAFKYLKETTGHRAAAEVQVRLRRELYRQTLVLGPGALDRKRTGDVLVSLVEGVDQLESFFGEYLPQLVVAALTPIGVFVFMAFLDLPVALVYLGFALFTVFAPAVFHRWNQAGSERRRLAYGELSAELLDSVQGLATLKAFGQSGARGDELAKRARHVFRSTMAVMAANQSTIGITWLGMIGGAAVALALGAVRVGNGSLELAPLLVVVMLGVEVFRPLRELTELYHRGMLAMSAAAAVFDLLDSKPQVEDAGSGDSTSEGLGGGLELKGVTFTYPDRDQPALDGVDIEVREGETLGVVGPSGAGKSTLVSLALRFFDPDAGRILLGGRDLRELPLAAARRHIAVVAQDTYLFHGTVAENLRLGRPGADSGELEQAARTANAHGFISALPQGYDTLIGERGIRLSGGQRQRIAIARALLKDSPILIMDEALSSVDAESESVIQEALDRLMEGRTTLIIAHRLSSVVNADRIVVLDEGRVVEEGSHSSLMRRDGVYRRVMGAQLAGVPGPGDGRVSGALDPIEPPASPESPPGRLEPAESTPAGPALGWAEVFARLLELVRPWRAALMLTFILGVLRVFVLVGVGVASALIARQVAGGDGIAALLAALAVLAALTPLLHFGESWVAHDVAFRLLAEMRVAMYRKLDRISPAYLVHRRSGDIISTITTDVETIELFFAHTIAPAFVAVVVPAAVIATLAVFQWPLALILLPFLGAVALTPMMSKTSLDQVGFEARRQLGGVNAHMVDGVQGLREILAFGAEDARLREVEENQRQYAGYRLRFLRHVTIQRVLTDASMGLGGLAVLGAGAYFVTQGSLSAGLLALLTLMALSAFIPVQELTQIAKQLADTVASSRRVFAIHDEPEPVRDGSGGGPRGPDRSAPGVRFQHVSFAYGPGLPLALRDVSLHAAPGRTLAIVGRSGAGKTTSAHLLLRFWDPSAGKITLDGRDLRDMRLDDLRAGIALVAQDTYLFNTTIGENLRIARPEATDDEIVRAAAQANAHEFIGGMPMGYDTPVGERGVQLSGGQKQRIAIARAVLKDAPVLVLDEATSHLDAESERLVRLALDRLMEGRTTIVIAHRLSTVRDADNIVVLDAGAVVEQGTHNGLLDRGGLYAHLVSSQVVAEPAPAG